VASLTAVRGAADGTVGVRAAFLGDAGEDDLSIRHQPGVRLWWIDDSGRRWAPESVLQWRGQSGFLSRDDDGRGWHFELRDRLDERFADLRFVRLRLEVVERNGDATTAAEVPIGAPAPLGAGSACDRRDVFASCGPGAGCLGTPPRCAPVTMRLDGGRAEGVPERREAALHLSVALPAGASIAARAFPLDAAGRPLAAPVSVPWDVPWTCAASQAFEASSSLAVADWTAVRALRVRIEGDGLPDSAPVDVPFRLPPLSGDGEPCGLRRTGLPDCEAKLVCRPAEPGGDRGACASPVTPAIDEARAARTVANGPVTVGVTGEAPDQDVSTLAMHFLDERGAAIGQRYETARAWYGDAGRFEVRQSLAPEDVPRGTRAIRVAVYALRDRQSNVVDAPIGAPANVGGACRGLPFDRCPAGQVCARASDASPGACVDARLQRVRDAWFVVRDAAPRLAIRVETENASSAPTSDVHCSVWGADGDPLAYPPGNLCSRPVLDVHPDAVSEVREYAVDVPADLALVPARLAAIEVQYAGATFRALPRPADDLAAGASCDPRAVVARCGGDLGCVDADGDGAATCVDLAHCR
jgi:hypothetical protein